MLKSIFLILIFLANSTILFSATFHNNGDGTITDLDTELIWQQKDDNSEKNWKEALDYCNELVLPINGHDDWRLPDIKELSSIADYAYSQGQIPIDSGFEDVKIQYWSSTTRVGKPSYAWIQSYGFVGSNGSREKINYNYVRCVRSEMKN